MCSTNATIGVAIFGYNNFWMTGLPSPKSPGCYSCSLPHHCFCAYAYGSVHRIALAVYSDQFMGEVHSSWPHPWSLRQVVVYLYYRSPCRQTDCGIRDVWMNWRVEGMLSNVQSLYCGRVLFCCCAFVRPTRFSPASRCYATGAGRLALCSATRIWCHDTFSPEDRAMVSRVLFAGGKEPSPKTNCARRRRKNVHRRVLTHTVKRVYGLSMLTRVSLTNYSIVGRSRATIVEVRHFLFLRGLLNWEA